MNSATAGSFKDHPRKVNFRQKWAKPILKYLHQRLNRKLIYLGLPGFRALDVLEWKDYLNVIIAFQVQNYEGREDTSDAEREMAELLSILNDLEAKGVIDTYSLYNGYIEQVVMGEVDEDDEPFIIDGYITVYNLDFCNTLSKPYPVVDKRGNVFDCYKSDVIDKLLSIERKKYIKGIDASFVMFLTVESHFLESMVINIDNKTIKDYIKKNLHGVLREKRLVRLLKAYAFYKLNETFKKHNFHIEILPTIYYQGSGTYFDKETHSDKNYWLLTFTILGTPYDVNKPALPFDQDFKSFLEKKFVFISDKGLGCYTDSSHNIIEKDFEPNIHLILQESHTMNVLWSDKT